MDKDKIIDYILKEWAMRSSDGLVGGYNTSENIVTLNEILQEYGLDTVDSVFKEGKRPANAGEDYEYLFKVMDPKNPKRALKLISIGHPDSDKYPDYPEADKYTGPHELEIDQYRIANDANINNALAASEKDPVYSPLRNTKKVSLANVRKLKEILSGFENKKLVNKFRELYDSIETIEKAIKIYKGELYPELQPLINKIDANRFAGAGRGEIPIVFLLEGASSGGNRKMDIIFAELGDKEGGIEVKEVTGGTIAISAPTLDGFSTSKFNVAIHELALLASRMKESEAFLLKVLNDAGTSKGGLYPDIAKGPDHEKHQLAIAAFFEDPKVGEVSQFLLDALFIISEKIARRKEEGGSMGADTVGSIEIDIGNKHREFKVPDDKIPALNVAVDAVQGEKTILNVPIAPKDEKSDEAIAEKAMKLSFFKESWDYQRVQKEIMDLILAKYTKMIIIDKRKKQNNAYLYESSKIATLEFVALGFGKIFMYVPGMGSSKQQAAGAEKSATS